MKDRLFLQIRSILLPYKERGGPYLLAFSGGIDSSALFHLLIKLSFPFHAAYVNHGWREASNNEALELKSLCESAGIPFAELKVSHFDFTRGNIEDRLRIERHRLLRAYAKKLGAKGLLFAHHRDDQVETVIKRLFEGARLTHLKGMRSEACERELTTIRPLLSLGKGEIKSWLDAHGYTYFDDPTNRDTRYLRARMREELLPQMERGFGKNIRASLALLAQRSAELSDYLDRRVAPAFDQLISDKGGWHLPLDGVKAEPVELKHLLSRVGDQLGVVINRSQMETLVSIISRGVSKKGVRIGSFDWVLEKGALKIKELR